MSKIKTAGQLRDYLATIMVSVGNGTCGPDKARNIVKIAGQINESLYAEVKVARLKLDLKQEAVRVGDLPIGGDQ